MTITELYEAVPSFTKVRLYENDLDGLQTHIGDFDPFRDNIPVEYANRSVLSVDASDKSELEVILD